MEHSISQSIDKGFGKEKWEPRKSVFTHFRAIVSDFYPNFFHREECMMNGP